MVIFDSIYYCLTKQLLWSVDNLLYVRPGQGTKNVIQGNVGSCLLEASGLADVMRTWDMGVCEGGLQSDIHEVLTHRSF